MKEIYRNYEIITENGTFGHNAKYGVIGTKDYETHTLNQKSAGDAILMCKFRIDYLLSKETR